MMMMVALRDALAVTRRYANVAAASVMLAVVGMVPTGRGQVPLFQSGFEQDSTILNAAGQPAASPGEAREMAGQDRSTGYDWETDLVTHGAPSDHGPLGNYNFLQAAAEHGSGISIIDDPTDSGRGRVMKFWLQTPGSKGRLQANVYGNDPNLNEVTCAVRMYLHPDLQVLEELPTAMNWFTIQELWTAPDWRKVGRNFRITLGLHKREGAGQKLIWAVHADEAGKGGKTFWEASHDVAGIRASDMLGQWITVVTYYRKGDREQGRFRCKVIPADGAAVELFDITNWTYHPTDPAQNTGLTHHSPQKLYGPARVFDWIREHAQGGQGAAIIYWDDLRYWSGDALAQVKE